MSTIEVSGTTETSVRPGYRRLPRWWVRANVSCPKCGTRAGYFCWGKGGPYPRTRFSNHLERVHAAELLASEIDARGQMGA